MSRKFPILNTTEYIDWDIVEPHRERAYLNHGQTLERLADRGGLSWYELLCVLLDKPFNDIPLERGFDYRPHVMKIVNMGGQHG